MSQPLSEARLAARKELVKQHVEAENLHNLDGVIATYCQHEPHFHIESANEYHTGDGVRACYADLFQGIPDVHIEVKTSYATDEVIIQEILFSGTHKGTWRGIPATGKEIKIPMCTIFWFDEEDRILGERIYFDGALLIQQLGMM